MAAHHITTAPIGESNVVSGAEVYFTLSESITLTYSADTNPALNINAAIIPFPL